jgi:hypothetical protein
MTTPHGSRPRHLSSSPFAAATEAVVEVFEVGERVCHDLYGLGVVTAVDTFAVTVDFGPQSVRVKPPYAKLEHL